MFLWRIASPRYDPLGGEGARIAGGRWHSPGHPVVYTSTHPALAVLEKLVWTDPEDVPDDLSLCRIELPDELAPSEPDMRRLPKSWQEVGCLECIALGDAWLTSGASLALSVPSAILPEARSVLLNPRHPAAARLQVAEARPFRFDLRLLR
jgi:RES domain-containing protein